MFENLSNSIRLDGITKDLMALDDHFVEFSLFPVDANPASDNILIKNDCDIKFTSATSYHPTSMFAKKESAQNEAFDLSEELTTRIHDLFVEAVMRYRGFKAEAIDYIKTHPADDQTIAFLQIVWKDTGLAQHVQITELLDIYDKAVGVLDQISDANGREQDSTSVNNTVMIAYNLSKEIAAENVEFDVLLTEWFARGNKK